MEHSGEAPSTPDTDGQHDVAAVGLRADEEVDDAHAGSGGVARALTPRQWVGLLALTLSTFIVVLDTTVVFIALPVILLDLDGTLDSATWVIAAFILTFAVLLLVFGKLGDIYGRRLLCLLGIAVFTLASLACSLAPSLEFLIAARVGQGVGAAMVEPTVLALIKTTFPKGRVGLAFGVQGVAAGVAASLGPILGGALTARFSWHAIFLINVPIGMLAIAGIALSVPETRDPNANRRLDLPGLLLSGAGILLVVFAIIEGETLGWGSPTILGSAIAGIAALAAFVLVERRVAHPLLDLELFDDRLYTVGNLLRGAVEFITLGVFFPLALFLQIQIGYNALETGLALLPLVAGSLITSPFAGSLSDRIDVRWIVVPGLLIAATGIAWLSFLEPDATWLSLLLPLAVLGLGLGSLYGTVTSATLRNVPEGQIGTASGISYTAFLLGSELGLAVVAAVLQNRLISGLQTPLAQAGYPPSAAEQIGGSLTGGSGDTTAGAFPPQLQEIFGAVFTDAVSTALWVCAAIAFAAAALALMLSSASAQPHGRRSSGVPVPEHSVKERQ